MYFDKLALNYWTFFLVSVYLNCNACGLRGAYWCEIISEIIRYILLSWSKIFNPSILHITIAITKLKLRHLSLKVHFQVCLYELWRWTHFERSQFLISDYQKCLLKILDNSELMKSLSLAPYLFYIVTIKMEWYCLITLFIIIGVSGQCPSLMH